MKNKKLLTILGLTAVAANLGYASLVSAQGTLGEVNVGCATTNAPTAIFANLASTITFGTATYGAGTQTLNMTNAAPFYIDVIDPRGFDNTAAEACGDGWSLRINANQANFDRNTVADTNLAAGAITVNQTGWGTPAGATITAVDGATTGVDSTNISGSTGNLTISTTEQTILSTSEAVLGTARLTFAATSDDVQVTVPSTITPGTYTLPLTLTFS